MKNLNYAIGIFFICSSSVHAVGSPNLIDVQNNYQYAKIDADNKKSLVEKATDDVTSAKSDLADAQKNLKQAQTNLSNAQTALKQKQNALTKANLDLAKSNENLKIAKDTVNQTWQSSQSATK